MYLFPFPVANSAILNFLCTALVLLAISDESRCSDHITISAQGAPDFDIHPEDLQKGRVLYFSTAKSPEKMAGDELLNKAWNDLNYRNIEYHSSSTMTYLKTAYYVPGVMPESFRNKTTLSQKYINSTIPGVTYIDPSGDKNINIQVNKSLAKRSIPFQRERLLITKKTINPLLSVKSALYASEYLLTTDRLLPAQIIFLLSSGHGLQMPPT